MRDRPLLIVAAHLGADVIDGFLDELKNSMRHFGIRQLTKALKKPCERPFSISFLAICPGGKYTYPAAACPQSRPPAM